MIKFHSLVSLSFLFFSSFWNTSHTSLPARYYVAQLVCVNSHRMGKEKFYWQWREFQNDFPSASEPQESHSSIYVMNQRNNPFRDNEKTFSTTDDSTPDNGVLSGFMDENLFQEDHEITKNDYTADNLVKVTINLQVDSFPIVSPKKLNFYEQILFQNAEEIYRKSIRYLPHPPSHFSHSDTLVTSSSGHISDPSHAPHHQSPPPYCGVGCVVNQIIGKGQR
jgi:hypothetical protein